MKIIVNRGMVNIDHVKMAYANIKWMYKEGRNGAGIQLCESLKNKSDDINEICDRLSNLIYKLDDVLNGENVDTQSQDQKTNEQEKQ